MWGTRDYNAPLVEDLLKKLGDFDYNDEASQKMLADLEMSVRARDEVRSSESDVEKYRYLGQWCGSFRHG